MFSEFWKNISPSRFVDNKLDFTIIKDVVWKLWIELSFSKTWIALVVCPTILAKRTFLVYKTSRLIYHNVLKKTIFFAHEQNVV